MLLWCDTATNLSRNTLSRNTLPESRMRGILPDRYIEPVHTWPFLAVEVKRNNLLNVLTTSNAFVNKYSNTSTSNSKLMFFDNSNDTISTCDKDSYCNRNDGILTNTIHQIFTNYSMNSKLFSSFFSFIYLFQISLTQKTQNFENSFVTYFACGALCMFIMIAPYKPLPM